MNKVDTTGKYGAAGVMLLLLFNLQSQVGQMRSDMNLVMAAVGVDRMRQVSVDNGDGILFNDSLSVTQTPGENHGQKHKKSNADVCDDRQSDIVETEGQRIEIRNISFGRNE